MLNILTDIDHIIQRRNLINNILIKTIVSETMNIIKDKIREKKQYIFDNIKDRKDEPKKYANYFFRDMPRYNEIFLVSPYKPIAYSTRQIEYMIYEVKKYFSRDEFYILTHFDGDIKEEPQSLNISHVPSIIEFMILNKDKKITMKTKTGNIEINFSEYDKVLDFIDYMNNPNGGPAELYNILYASFYNYNKPSTFILTKELKESKECKGDFNSISVLNSNIGYAEISTPIPKLRELIKDINVVGLNI